MIRQNEERIQTKTTDKWLNVVIGVASVAAVALVCLMTYLSIKHSHKWKQREKTAGGRLGKWLHSGMEAVREECCDHHRTPPQVKRTSGLMVRPERVGDTARSRLVTGLRSGVSVLTRGRIFLVGIFFVQ
ncbi:hypothetical protein EVAR_34715_1 [Eumeta japonica]|uniref:Uncharacterized protein n=1 Tax=Eumeta variegata TaxID=151549 RepID=A0A4C1XGQ7_EUMVA|nr:hypothetical protein EVAR_34715_1 [Eumeta japonica]